MEGEIRISWRFWFSEHRTLNSVSLLSHVRAFINNLLNNSDRPRFACNMYLNADQFNKRKNEGLDTAKMEVTFLGTCSGGGPTESRNCSSLVLDMLSDYDLWSTIAFHIAPSIINHFKLISGRLCRRHRSPICSTTTCTWSKTSQNQSCY